MAWITEHGCSICGCNWRALFDSFQYADGSAETPYSTATAEVQRNFNSGVKKTWTYMFGRGTWTANSCQKYENCKGTLGCPERPVCSQINSTKGQIMTTILFMSIS